jgi:hypothetical protein
MKINGESENKSLLRFTTAGSVDDGKSTLIGRLLYDSKSIFEDQMEHIVQSGKRLGRQLTLPIDTLQPPQENLSLPILQGISNIQEIWLQGQVQLTWL